MPLTRSALIGVMMLILTGGSGAQTAQEIRTEALRKNNDPAGHPLPLLASWNTGTYSYAYPGRARGIDPAYQLELIKKGHHILLSFQFPAMDATLYQWQKYYEAPLEEAQALNLPIALVSTQWERELITEKEYVDLPPDQNPGVVTLDGKVLEELSPFGPLQYYKEIGAKWASSPMMKQIQQWYPDPVLVELLSNNETPKLRWQDVETSARYLQEYGTERSDDFKRKVIADAWVERFRAMQDGMREALSKSWQSKVFFVGYDAFGPAFMGRWDGWVAYSLFSKNRIDPSPLMWDGGSPSYYTNNWDGTTDYKVWGPPVESMNWVFMQKQAYELNPNFWFGFSIWDGHNGEEDDKRLYYERQGQSYTPQRYASFAQFGLWLLRPRVIREFRDWTSDLEEMEPWFTALADDVDRVYQNDTLKYFWRKGTLVPNHAHQHPYQSSIPEEYQNVDRWFLLDTNLDAPRPWTLDTEIPVYSLALVQGTQGNRRWLVYAESPLKDRKSVKITVPDYGNITVDVPVAGAFYVVNEKTRTVQPA